MKSGKSELCPKCGRSCFPMKGRYVYMIKQPLVRLEYQEGEDGLLYPKIQISENRDYDRRIVGMFGRQWKDYMREKHPQRLSELIAQCRIN